MTYAQRRYLAVETAIAAMINAALSIAFTFAVFGGRAAVPVWGTDGLIVDSLLQSLMVAAMSTLVPTLLTRMHVRKGKVAALTTRGRGPRHILIRVAIVGVGVAAFAGLVHAIVLPLTGETWSFTTALGFKTVYGALLGATVAWHAARDALHCLPW